MLESGMPFASLYPFHQNTVVSLFNFFLFFFQLSQESLNNSQIVSMLEETNIGDMY